MFNNFQKNFRIQTFMEAMVSRKLTFTFLPCNIADNKLTTAILVDDVLQEYLSANLRYVKEE